MQGCKSERSGLPWLPASQRQGETIVSTRNLVLYALNSLGPYKIQNEIDNMRGDGFTTIVIGMFHIGNPSVAKNTQLGDIIFNGGEPIVIRAGKDVSNAPNWPRQIAKLKGDGSSVTKVYACFGGGDPVQNFSTIKEIYDKHRTFEGTQLKRNLAVFRKTFPAFDGIDMDCEDAYDLPSFVAFCEMMIGMGYDITFCPYAAQDFWNNALARIDKHPGAKVKWWNLQCYAGGAGNNPKDWSPPGAPPGYIIPGDWGHFWDPEYKAWFGDCPAPMGQLFKTFSGQSAVGGGFVYELDLIRDTIKNIPIRGTHCESQEPRLPVIYREFVQRGLAGK